MRVWIYLEDLQKLAFVVSPHPSYHDTLTGFHLSLSMGYVDISLRFFYVSETVTELANLRWATATITAPHPLSALAETPLYPNEDSQTGIISAELYTSTTARLPPRCTVVVRLYVDV